MSDGSVVRGRSVVVATGVDYRRLDVPELEALVGRGVFYGAAVSEAPSMTGQQVYVVGGGNSAGQAALHLARYARQVTLLVRGPSLAASMSDYLIAQLEATRNVDDPLPRGGARRPRGRRLPGGADRGRPAAAASRRRCRPPGSSCSSARCPARRWLPDEVMRDEAGFVRTGPDTASRRRMAQGRARLPLETSLPGVFAIGDVRAGSIKRVATAVGDGATVIALLHGYLAAHPVTRPDADPVTRRAHDRPRRRRRRRRCG